MGSMYSRLWETRQWQDVPRGRGAGLAWRPPWGRAGVPVATIKFVSSLVCAGWLSVASDMGDGRRRPPGRGEGSVLGSRGSGTVFTGGAERTAPGLAAAVLDAASGPRVPGKAASSKWTRASEVCIWIFPLLFSGASVLSWQRWLEPESFSRLFLNKWDSYHLHDIHPN